MRTTDQCLHLALQERLILLLLTTISLSSVFDLFLLRIFLGFGLIPAPGSFAASAFPVPPRNPGSLPECSRSLWEQKPSLLCAPRKWGRKRRNTMYLNSATIVGFVGADPEQRQARNNGAKFTVLSVATQRSWKNAQDEWSSKTEWHRVCIFRPHLGHSISNPRNSPLFCIFTTGGGKSQIAQFFGSDAIFGSSPPARECTIQHVPMCPTACILPLC
jgi:hypothetical protein